MAKKKRKKASKGGWSAAKLSSYKKAKRKLINIYKKSKTGKVTISG